MISSDYLKFLDQAIQSPCGVALEVSDARDARRIRRRLYAARDKARAEGNGSYNDLSVLVRPDYELWIVKRQLMPRLTLDDGLDTITRDLAEEELPRRVTARGPSQPRPSRLFSILSQ